MIVRYYDTLTSRWCVILYRESSKKERIATGGFPFLQTYTDTRRTPLLLGRRLCRRPQIFSFRINKDQGTKKGAQVQPHTVGLTNLHRQLPLRPCPPPQLSKGQNRGFTQNLYRWKPIAFCDSRKFTVWYKGFVLTFRIFWRLRNRSSLQR